MGPDWALPAALAGCAGIALGAALTACASARWAGPERPGVVDGLAGLVGGTPLVRIGSLSDATGREILAKAEFLNPGGSVKDRVALAILADAAARGALAPGGVVTEGTSGSTGVSLALLAPLFGARAAIWMPDDAAAEKGEAMEALGAAVHRVRPASIASPLHFVNQARRAAEAAAGRDAASPAPSPSPSSPASTAVHADQFENLANAAAHAATGAEIWRQTRGRVAAFVSGAGTGGTLAGVAAELKRRSPGVAVLLVDPPGSSLHDAVARGVAYHPVEAEGTRVAHPADTITEGVGLNRLTANFSLALPFIDGAVRCSDAEAVAMARHVRAHDGLWAGSSAAVNLVGAVKAAAALPPGAVVVTLLCDGGARHASKFWSGEWVAREAGVAAAVGPVRGREDLGFLEGG